MFFILKIPPSIPKAWAREISSFEPELNIIEQKMKLDEEESHYGYMTRDIIQWDFKDLPKNDYLAVLMDPPWKINNSEEITNKTISVDEFVR